MKDNFYRCMETSVQINMYSILIIIAQYDDVYTYEYNIHLICLLNIYNIIRMYLLSFILSNNFNKCNINIIYIT